jgi:hypothetical protein
MSFVLSACLFDGFKHLSVLLPPVALFAAALNHRGVILTLVAVTPLLRVLKSRPLGGANDSRVGLLNVHRHTVQGAVVKNRTTIDIGWAIRRDGSYGHHYDGSNS